MEALPAAPAQPYYPSNDYVKLYRRLERFRRLVAIDPHSGCWDWLGCHNRSHYGVFKWITSRRGSTMYAHRAAWLLFRGPLPIGLVLHHICGIRGCVNPWHLEAVTPSENLAIQGWFNGREPGFHYYAASA